MASGGWQFSVTVPSWTQASLEGDENIVFYRVEVKVLPPEADAAPRTRSVLRRFNHFTKLHQRLKEELGAKKMAKLETPSKNRLGSVNKRPDLVEKRRRELESWLWKLIGDGEIARSQVLNKFLELSDAARLVQRVMPSPQLSRPPSQTGSYAWSEGGGSSVHDGSQPSVTTSFQSSSQHAPAGFDVLPGQVLPPLQRSISDASHVPSISQQPMARSVSTSVSANLGPADATSASTDQGPFPARSDAGGSHAGAPHAGGSQAGGPYAEQLQQDEPHMRLGLRMHQRVAVQQHVRALQQQLDTAAGDLQDAMEAIFTERRNKRELAAQMADLQARASEAGIMQAAATQADLEQSLQQQQAAAQQLQQDLDKSNDTAEQLREQLTEAQRLLEAGQQAVAREQHASAQLKLDLQERDARIQESDHRLADTQQQVADAQQNLEESIVALQSVRQTSAQTEHALNDAHAQISRLEEQSAAHQAAASTAQAQLDRTVQEVATEQAVSAAFREELSGAQSQKAELRAQLSDSQSQLTVAQKKLADSQQGIAKLEAQLGSVKQELSHAQRTQSPGDTVTASAAQESPEHDASSAATVGQDQPSVAPPQEGGVQGSQLHNPDGTDAASADDAKVAAVHAELVSYKQQAAAAESKGRADRKLLAKEVKNLRKLLDEQKQQAAAKEAAVANAEPAAPVAVHIHVAAAASEEPAAAVSSMASQQTPSSQAATSAVLHEHPETLPSTSQASTSMQTEPTELDADPAAGRQRNLTSTATQTNDAPEPKSSRQHGHELNDLLTGSVDAGVGTSAAAPQIPLTMDLLGLDTALPETALAQTSPKAYQQSSDRQSADSLDVAQPASSAGAETALPVQSGTDAQPSTSTSFTPSLSHNQADSLSATLDASSDMPTNRLLATAHASDIDTDEPSSSSQATAPLVAAVASHDTNQLETATNATQAVSTNEAYDSHDINADTSSSRTTTDVDSGRQYQQLLQEVFALRHRLHDCSVEALEGQADSRDLTPQQSMELLSTCDGRIQALMAEADLLGQPVQTGSSSAAAAALEAQVRQAFASILIESGSLRQRINALLRDKYENELHGRDAHSQQAAADGRGLFQKFRPPGISFLNSQANGNGAQTSTEDAPRPNIGQALGDRFAGFGDRFSKSFRPQQ